MNSMNSLSISLLLHFLALTLICFSYSSATPYDTFVQCIKTQPSPNDQVSSLIYSPNNSSYTSILQAYIKNSRLNTSSTPKPILIVTPLQPSHVQATVTCAKTANVQIKIRSGGHDYEGISYISSEPNFIVLDMFNLRNISVDIQAQTAYVQAGANVGELWYNIWSKSKVHGFPAGVCPTLGIGGHISGGGYGNMLRKYGLTVDHVVDAEIVDINGKILNRTTMGEDLFWAIRGGGGGSFGVILSFTVNLVSVPETVTVFKVSKTLAQNATNVVYRWQFLPDTLDNDLFIRVLLQPNNGTVLATFIGMFLGDSSRLLGIADKAFPELGLKQEDCLEMSWIQSVLWWANFDNTTTPDILLNRHSDTVGFGKRKSDYIQSPIPVEGLEAIWKKMVQVGKVGFVFNMYGGKMNEIPATDTAFPHRAGNLFKMQYSVNWHDGGAEAEKNYLDQSREIYDFMTPYVSKNPRGAFLNYRDLDIGVNTKNSYHEGKVYGEKYFLGNFDRLVQVKTKVDSNNFFRNEQNIPVMNGKSGAIKIFNNKSGLILAFVICFLL